MFLEKPFLFQNGKRVEERCHEALQGLARTKHRHSRGVRGGGTVSSRRRARRALDTQKPGTRGPGRRVPTGRGPRCFRVGALASVQPRLRRQVSSRCKSVKAPSRSTAVSRRRARPAASLARRLRTPGLSSVGYWLGPHEHSIPATWATEAGR